MKMLKTGPDHAVRVVASKYKPRSTDNLIGIQR